MARDYSGGPTNTGRSIKDRADSAASDNPLKLVPNKTATIVGETIRLRILSLDPSQTRVVRCAKVDQAGKGKGSGRVFTEYIHSQLLYNDPEEVIAENALADFFDDSGTCVAELKTGDIFRIPVWFYGIGSKKGFDDKDELKFLEVTWGIFKDIMDLEDDRQMDLTFDEKIGKPMYDIEIYRNDPSGKDTWRVYGVQFTDKKPDANYNVTDEEAIGKDGWKAVTEGWAELQEAMDDFMTPEQIRRKLSGGKVRSGISNRPSMPDGAEEEEEEQQDVPEADTKRTAPTSSRGTRPAPEEKASGEANKGGGTAVAEPEAEEDTKREFGFRRRKAA